MGPARLSSSPFFLAGFFPPCRCLDDRKTDRGSQPGLGPGGPFCGPGRSARSARFGFVGWRIRIKCTGGGFSWLFSEGFRDVQVGMDTQEKYSGNRSVRLIFDGKSNISFAGVCHYVPVQPSTAYRFSAWVKTRTLTTDQGIRFQLHSLGTQDSSTAVTLDVHGSTPWTRIESPWSSGNDVQELQVCLVRFSSEEAENKIQGTAWVDNVALVPEPAEHPKP